MSQGSVLGLYIFDWLMRNASIDDLGFTTHKHQSSRIPETRVDDLEYTDGIGLIKNEKDKVQKQLDALYRVVKKVELLINVDKIKVLLKTSNQHLKSNLMKQCLKW